MSFGGSGCMGNSAPLDPEGGKRGIKTSEVKEWWRSREFIVNLGCRAGNQGCCTRQSGIPKVSVCGAGGQQGITSGKSSCQGLCSQKLPFPPPVLGREMREERGECSREIDFSCSLPEKMEVEQFQRLLVLLGEALSTALSHQIIPK